MKFHLSKALACICSEEHTKGDGIQGNVFLKIYIPNGFDNFSFLKIAFSKRNQRFNLDLLVTKNNFS